MISKQEAQEWSDRMIRGGTYPLRHSYKENNEIGAIAQDVWDDGIFTLGIEYGILMAIWYLYRDQGVLD